MQVKILIPELFLNNKRRILMYLNLNIFILHCKDSRKVKFVYKIGTYVRSIRTTVILRNRTRT